MPLTKAPKRRLRKGVEKKNTAISTSGHSPSQPPTLPLELQQRVLDAFRDAFSDSTSSPLHDTIQEIKQHLFNRDFGAAFGSSVYREAYATRWSPTRALTYLEILCSQPAISILLLETSSAKENNSELSRLTAGLSMSDGVSAHQDASPQCRRIVNIGSGGGAELVALAGTLHHLNIQSEMQHNADDHQRTSSAFFDCLFVDIADWSLVLQKLHTNVVDSFSLAIQDMSVTRKSTNIPNGKAPKIATTVVQQDILEAWSDEFEATLTGACLVTIMFTLNELYNSSMASTTRMLLSLTSLLEPGAILLVVDSPGSYSTVSLEKAPDTVNDSSATAEPNVSSKRYPMHWLLDHTLLETATVKDSQDEPRKQWKTLDSQESQWFRLSPQLKYPLDLEDMRYQMHVYQKL